MKNPEIADNDLKQALAAYTQGAATGADKVKERVLNRLPSRAETRAETARRVYFPRLVTAAASVLLLLAFFVYTPAGAAFAAAIKENIIDRLFPPKELAVTPEGFTDEITHTPQTVSGISAADAVNEGAAGADVPEPGTPDADADATEAAEDAAAYVIYVDESRYRLMEENGVAVIRPLPAERPSREDVLADMGHLWRDLDGAELEKKIEGRLAELEAFYSSLPECKIEITRNAQSAGETSAAELDRLQSAYTHVGAIEHSELPAGFRIRAAAEPDWDAQTEDVYIVDDQKGGAFILRAQYYQEAAEGHGTRFRTMIESFTVLPETAGQ